MFQDAREGDGVLESVKENIEGDAGFKNVRVKAEVGINEVEFCICLRSEAGIQIVLGTMNVLYTFERQRWRHGQGSAEWLMTASCNRNDGMIRGFSNRPRRFTF